VKAYKFNVCGKFRNTVFGIVLWGGLSFTCQALADEKSNISTHRFDNWEQASDSELDQLRGGFVLPNGINIDFNLERITSLNGGIISSSFFQLPDGVSLFQNGALNQAPDSALSGLGSVIQNNIDNQVIRTVTEINIAVSNLRNVDLNNNSVIFNNLILPNVN